MSGIKGPRKADTVTIFAVGDGQISDIVRRFTKVQVEEAELDFDSPDMILKPETIVRGEADPETGIEEEIVIPAVMKADPALRGKKFLQVRPESLAEHFPDAVGSDGQVRLDYLFALVVCSLQEAVSEYDALRAQLMSRATDGTG